MPRSDGFTPVFSALGSGTGLRIDDPVERRQYALYTPTPVTPEPVPTDTLGFPVDAAATITTTELRLGELVTVFVHGARDELPVQVLPGSEVRFEPGEYHAELDAAVKLYLGISGGFDVEAGATDVSFSFPGTAEVVVGARSFHQRPAATISTTDRPEDVMTAISYLGSALKTTSAERAYPTLRGHPPEIELGDRLHVPAGLERPETGVEIALPPARGPALVAAPLAYYLGAGVSPGDPPGIVTASGYVYPLPSDDRSFEREVERVLKQTFLLDCLTRTEGYYRIELGEREALAAALDLDLAGLYGMPLATRLERYLEVPYERVESEVPSWALTAHLPPTPESVEAVPYVVNELAIVRTSTARELSPADVRHRVLHRYFEDAGEVVRAGGSVGRTRFVEVEASDSMDDAWFGDGTPIGATQGVPQAYRNRFERTPGEGVTEIAVVCNDRQMAEEGSMATDAYGSREEFPFDVALHQRLDRDELAGLLASHVDFLHYVGHVSEEGFHCPDGVLAAEAVPDVGVDVFFLNGCASVEPGRHLIQAGSIGGVVTVGDVIDSGARAVGRTMARLLSLGFPLRAALSLARRESVVGGQYVVLGDGNADVAAARDGPPLLCELETVRDGGYELTVRTYLPRGGGMGTTVFPTLEANDSHYLAPRAVTFRVTRAELDRYLERHPYPVRVDGELVWNERVDGTAS